MMPGFFQSHWRFKAYFSSGPGIFKLLAMPLWQVNVLGCRTKVFPERIHKHEFLGDTQP